MYSAQIKITGNQSWSQTWAWYLMVTKMVAWGHLVVLNTCKIRGGEVDWSLAMETEKLIQDKEFYEISGVSYIFSI